MSISERALAKLRANYEAMDDESLAFIAVNRVEDLTEEARLALDEVTRHRDSEKFRALLDDIEKEPRELPRKKTWMFHHHLIELISKSAGRK